MRKRLDTLLKRHEEIDAELADPAIENDIAHLTALTKERASLDEPYELYRTYLKTEQDAKDALALIESGDPDLAEAMKEERKTMLKSMEEMEERFKVLLIPVDPNDSKNIIVEIRGAVGGDEANLFAKDSSSIGSARVSGTLFSNVLMEENLSNPYSVGNTSNKISKDYCRQGGEYIY